MRKFIFSVATVLVASGCATNVSVKPVKADNGEIAQICIQKNPQVIVPEFTEILEEGFAKHAVETEIYSSIPISCQYKLTYTATQKWDFVAFLHSARLDLYKDNKLIGYAERKAPSGIFGGGGINPSKWKSDRSKVFPMIDELMSNISPAK